MQCAAGAQINMATGGIRKIASTVEHFVPNEAAGPVERGRI